MSSATAILPFMVQALQYIQQAIDSGVAHASLFHLKGDLSADEPSSALQALAAYKESHRLSPSWRAMMGCAKAAFAANKRHEVRTRSGTHTAALRACLQGGSSSTESPGREGLTLVPGCPSARVRQGLMSGLSDWNPGRQVW